MSYDPQRAIERLRRLDEIEAELKTIEKKLYWRQGNHSRAVLACRYLSSPRSKTRATASNDDQGKELPMTDMTVVHDKMKAIATAHADYVKSSFEANNAYLTKLATIRAPDQAMQITTDHMKSAYETFVAESTKIGDMDSTSPILSNP